MKAKRKLIGIFAFILLFITGAGLFLTSKSDEGSAAPEEVVDTRTSAVLVAVSDIEPGNSASDTALRAKLEVRTIPLADVAPDAIKSLEELDAIVGRLNEAVPAGGQLRASMFAEKGFVAAAATVDVPPELFTMAFSLDAQRVLGGQLRNGDKIGLIASYSDPASLTHMYAANVLVVDVRADNVPVDPNTGEAVPAGQVGQSQLGNVSVIIAVDAQTIEKTAHVMEFGRLWLAVQGPSATTAGSGVQDAESVLGTTFTAEQLATPTSSASTEQNQ